MEELKKEIENANSLIGNKKLNAKIKDATTHLDCKSIKERVFCILNDITEIPTCKCCTKNVKFDKLKNEYGKFCGSRCYNKWRKLDKEIRTNNVNEKLLQDKENYIECKVCGSAVKSIAAHLKLKQDEIHQNWDLERYKKEFPNEPIISKNTSKILSENSKGENNPMHSSKTTKEFRKSVSPFSIEFYKRKYPNETLEQQQNRLQGFINSVDYDSRLTETQLDYWIEKCEGDLEKANKLYKERQRTFTKEKCVKKYGEQKGLEVWKERQEKWQNTLNTNGSKCGYSKISQELFRTIEDGTAHYGEKNGEIRLYDINKKMFLYDFVQGNKIIEYHGDQYHANPNIYKEHEMSHPYRKEKGYTAKDIWEKDAYKQKIAEEHGYVLLVIWDSEYRKNPNRIVNKCLDFLNS